MTKFWSWETWENIAVSAGCGTAVGIASGVMGAGAWTQSAVTGVAVVVSSLAWEYITGK